MKKKLEQVQIKGEHSCQEDFEEDEVQDNEEKDKLNLIKDYDQDKAARRRNKENESSDNDEEEHEENGNLLTITNSAKERRKFKNQRQRFPPLETHDLSSPISPSRKMTLRADSPEPIPLPKEALS